MYKHSCNYVRIYFYQRSIQDVLFLEMKYKLRRDSEKLSRFSFVCCQEYFFLEGINSKGILIFSYCIYKKITKKNSLYNRVGVRWNIWSFDEWKICLKLQHADERRIKISRGIISEEDIFSTAYIKIKIIGASTFPKINVYLKTCFRKYKIFNMNDHATNIFFFLFFFLGSVAINHKSLLSFA